MLKIIAISCAALLSLAACETVKGVGKDIQKGGEAMERAVE